ncbi:MAG: hypothetical protein JWQ74_3602 [Marmoricola sp.]|jgi:hypothetical protein|nr:hypothetical protein [Marmoricola sp.]
MSSTSRSWLVGGVIAILAGVAVLALTSGRYGVSVFGVALVAFVMAAVRYRADRRE